MNKKSVLLKIIGVCLLLVPFGINKYSIVRFISVLLGILILCISLLMFQKKKGIKILLYPILFFIFVYGIDYASIYFLNRIPVLAYQNVSSNTFSTYDSLIYRIYNCNDKQILDTFYKENYVCDDALEPIEINAFLNNDTNNYQKYHSKFITVKGKISEVFGNDYILLQSYEQQENNLVGQLTFNKNSGLKIINNHNNLKFYNYYEIYDNVLVTGKVVKKENNTIIMQDAKIEVINNFEDFSVQTIEDKTCKNTTKKLTSVGKYNYYSQCLDKIYVNFGEDTIYDIILALETQKLTFDKWTKDIQKEEKEEQELYHFDNYNLLNCKNSNTILIGNKKLKLSSSFCETITKEDVNAS